MPKQSTSLKLRKLNFMNRDRRVEPMTKNDKYILEYSISNADGGTLFGKINFRINLSRVILPSLFPQATFEGFNLGLDTAKSVGDGESADLSWHKFLSRSIKSEVFSLIY